MNGTNICFYIELCRVANRYSSYSCCCMYLTVRVFYNYGYIHVHILRPIQITLFAHPKHDSCWAHCLFLVLFCLDVYCLPSNTCIELLAIWHLPSEEDTSWPWVTSIGMSGVAQFFLLSSACLIASAAIVNDICTINDIKLEFIHNSNITILIFTWKGTVLCVWELKVSPV